MNYKLFLQILQRIAYELQIRHKREFTGTWLTLLLSSFCDNNTVPYFEDKNPFFSTPSTATPASKQGFLIQFGISQGFPDVNKYFAHELQTYSI